METIDNLELLEKFCMATGSWGVLLHAACDVESITEVEMKRAVPLLNDVSVDELLHYETVHLSFKDREEAETFYNTVIGDDGPTATNSYNGRARVFAVLVGPEGYVTENT